MCGIFCVFNPVDGLEMDSEYLEAVDAILHRGPDNSGSFSDSTCFMGHTRLSIIGIEENGNQPFYFDNLVMVFNGEIFNYIELREDLIKFGYKFSTRSDTEVIIKAFHKWGEACFAKFNGMWALVIYNKLTKTITASRDRFGQKPMFIMKTGECTYFSSELHQLIPFSGKKIDFELIQSFLKEGTYEGEGRTYIQGIEEFPKAHTANITQANEFDLVRYWNYWSGKVERTTDDDLIEFSNLLQDSVKIRLRADVPIGILVSGGVDSTMIACSASEISGGETIFQAFTYSSQDKDDEVKYAKELSQSLNMPLTIRYQHDNPLDYCKRLKSLVWHLGRGHSSPAISSIDSLYESVAQARIKVVLDGQGADELLAGYKTYFPMMVPYFMLKGRFKDAYYSLIEQFKFGYIQSILIFLRTILPTAPKKLLRYVYGYEKLFKTYTSSQKIGTLCKVRQTRKNQNLLNRHLIWQHDIGLENLLFYGDIVAMKHSVENRSPFMDHRLVDFAFRKDERLKLYNGIDKYVLRVMPYYRQFEQLLNRPKIGFSSDIKGPTQSLMVDQLKTSPILMWPIFSNKIKSFISGKQIFEPKYQRILFRLYQVHLWHELFQDKLA
jgi:asparagine synthase (glutamine-hydrolysing)